MALAFASGGGGGGGSQSLEQVLAVGNDANDLQIVNLADGVDPQDAATVGQLSAGGTPLDGWVDDSAETWTFATSTTFTVSGDVTAKYTVGTRIKLTQTTVKYFVVTANPSFTSSTTTVTISGGSDYTLANATISANSHSYVVNPQGYPNGFSYPLNATGFSAKTSDTGVFGLLGRTCTVQLAVTGTSNATTFTCDAPIGAPLGYNYTEILANNGTILGRIVLTANATSSAFTFGASTGSGGGFVASGSKGTAANNGVGPILQYFV